MQNSDGLGSLQSFPVASADLGVFLHGGAATPAVEPLDAEGVGGAQRKHRGYVDLSGTLSECASFLSRHRLGSGGAWQGRRYDDRNEFDRQCIGLLCH